AALDPRHGRDPARNAARQRPPRAGRTVRARSRGDRRAGPRRRLSVGRARHAARQRLRDLHQRPAAHRARAARAEDAVVNIRALALLCTAALCLNGCSDASNDSQAVAVLIDVSGTYADQKPDVARIVKREVLPGLVPGDTLAVVRIDSASYEKND